MKASRIRGRNGRSLGRRRSGTTTRMAEGAQGLLSSSQESLSGLSLEAKIKERGECVIDVGHRIRMFMVMFPCNDVCDIGECKLTNTVLSSF